MAVVAMVNHDRTVDRAGHADRNRSFPASSQRPPYGGLTAGGGGEHDAKARVPGQCFPRRTRGCR